VQFVDQDDELAPESLERLVGLAERNGSDIVLGKVFGTMAAPSNVFKRTVERCSVADAPLMESLTPHKMFRRSFLLDHGIKFAEGRVRLEDQLFMARAYLRARTVSILGDYPTYQWIRRGDGGNTSGGATTAGVYYHHLRQVVDAIKDGTTPGELQDRLLRRSYRVELLRPVTEPRVLQRKGDDLRTYFDTVRRMALECYPPGVTKGLPAVARLRASLLEEGRLDSLVELARRTQRIKPQVEMQPPVWRSGRLVLPVSVWHVRGDGMPLSLVERDGSMYLDPVLLAGIEGAEDWAVDDPFSYTEGELFVQDTTNDQSWFLDGELTAELRPLGHGHHHVRMTGEAIIDPSTLAGGSPMPRGAHDVWLTYQILGIGRHPPIASQQRPVLRVASVGSQVIAPSWHGPKAQLRLTASGPVRGVTVRRALTSAAAQPRLRRAVRRSLRKLPPTVRRRARSAVDGTAGWIRRGVA
jgi:hypothetical protein